jgi:uncharacterized protein YciI
MNGVQPLDGSRALHHFTRRAHKGRDMLFVVMAKDKPESLALRMATREAHFAYAQETGSIRLGGPFLDAKGDMAGSLIIIEAADLAAAKMWQQNDPYAKAGLFGSVDLQPWKPTFNPSNAKF